VCDCRCNRQTTKLFSYTNDQLNQGAIYTHKGCVCNEEIALAQRHQVDDGSRFHTKRNLKQHLRPLITATVPCSEDFIISRAKSSKKQLLIGAKESLAQESLKPSDGHVKMFLKDDKYHDGQDLAGYLGMEDNKKISAPRCIQYRNKRYCLRLATHLHPIEEATYGFKDWTGTPVFAKGLNLRQRGEALRNKWESFAFPKALLLDHSKFDAHVSDKLQDLENWYYLKCNNDHELRQLLGMQRINKGRTKNGTRYTTYATRMSGDQNTGLGNSVINYAMLADFLQFYGLKGSILVDGDDSVLIIEDEGKHYDLSFFKQFGMKTEGSETTDFSQVDFCQTKPVELEHGWTMVRNPYRLLLRMGWTTKVVAARKIKPYLASIGRCELALGMGAPIGQYIGHKLSLLSDKHIDTDLEWVAKQQQYRPRRAKLVEPTLRARSSYAEAWGISIEQQLEIEATGISLDVDVSALNVEERPYDQ